MTKSSCGIGWMDWSWVRIIDSADEETFEIAISATKYRIIKRKQVR